MKRLYFDMFYLLSCGINRVKPDMKLIEDEDMNALYNLSKAHFVEVIIGTALKQTGYNLSDEWTQKLSKSIRKNILFDSEREKIFNFMEQEGIWYLPLKGTILKEYYPSVGMRQMSDNDVLFDEKYTNIVQEYMKSQGYVGENIGKGAHDVYKKEPVYNFELHRTLFDSSVQSLMNIYYSDVKKRLILSDNREYGYHFSKEDFYIYIVAHAYKHYRGSGTGIRSLLDFYVYLSAEEHNMDFKYIQNECEKLEMSEFEASNRILCKKVFSKEFLVDYKEFSNSLSKSEHEMLEYYFSSGVYGTAEHGIENRIAKYQKKTGNKSKLRYTLHRLFPSINTYKSYYPFFYKYKFLLPIAWFYRLLRMLFSKKRRKTAIKEMNYVRKM